MSLKPIVIDPDTFLRQHCTLPALPEIVTRIQDLILSDNISISKVAEMISTDPGMVAQVLKVVNSAYYSFPKEIVDVNLAVAYLGINEIYRMVLSLAVLRTLDVDDKAGFSDIWTHSVYTALSSKYLAQKYEPLLPLGELWAASILHDIGKLVYLKFFPDHYKEARDLQHQKQILYVDAEKELGLPQSSYFGSLLCDHWRLPKIIKEVCSANTFYDLPDLEGDGMAQAFKRMVCLGSLAATLSMVELNPDVKSAIADGMKTALKCDESEFLMIMGAIYELRIEVDRFL